MEYRQAIESTPELAEWYNAKYVEMGDGWFTPPEECNRHLDDLGVPFDDPTASLGHSKRLLDVGCGAGHFLVEAQKRVVAIGIDISSVGVDHCTRRGATAFVGDISKDADMSNPSSLETFDYIVSLGSLEHVVDLAKALDNIRALLKPDGKFYFFCPNEKWKHFDQPNERTMTDAEWVALFREHGLYTTSTRRWNDSTAFIGDKTNSVPPVVRVPQGNKLCCGSGQRPYPNAQGWINIDIHDRWKPDIVADWNDLSMIASDSMDIVVAEQSVEHVGCGEANPFFKEAYRVLKPGGCLVITVPDLRALCQRWLTGQIDDFIFSVNLYGAFMGHDADRHKWNTSYAGWEKFLRDAAPWSKVVRGGQADVPVAADWWVLRIEATK